MQHNKYLFILTSSEEKLLRTTAIFRSLKKQQPSAYIALVTSKELKELVINNPNIDQLYFADGNSHTLSAEINLGNFSRAVDLDKNQDSEILLKSIYVPASDSKKTFLEKLLNWFQRKPKDEIENTFRELNVRNEPTGIDFRVLDKDAIGPDDLPTSHLAGYVAIVMNSIVRSDEIEAIKSIAAEIKFPIVLIGEKPDFPNAAKVRDADDVKIYNACGKYSFQEKGHLLKMARAVVSKPVSESLIAAAFGRNQIVLNYKNENSGMITNYDKALVATAKTNPVVEIANWLSNRELIARTAMQLVK